MSYAQDTVVSVEKSRAEIERILQRYGATKFMYGCDTAKAVICFEAKAKMVKFELPLPDRSDRRFKYTEHRRRVRTDDEAYKAWEQACRTRWRALALCVKAKLEAVSSGITTFESEFLAHFVMPNGKTLGEVAIPQLEAAVLNGQMPQLLIGNG
jgi:hypothetical protein